jgi:hypothetical protein
VTAGDLIRLKEVPREDRQVANMVVVTSKRGGCGAGAPIVVSLADLQEFKNAFAEKVEEGMQKMKTEIADKQHH